MTICSKCNKEYGTYPVFLSGKTESVAFEFSLRDIYYDDDRNMGLCKDCREKICSDKKERNILWALALGKLLVLSSDAEIKKDKDRIKKYSEAIKRIEETLK